MAEHHASVVVVVDDVGDLVGILSERDIVARVVARQLDPSTTCVANIMTKNVLTAQTGDSDESAILTMSVGHVQHLPVVDGSGAVQGMLTVFELLEHQLGTLSRRNVDLENFIAADGPGG